MSNQSLPAGDVLAPLPIPADGKETHPRSIAKALSWRLTGSIDTFVISFLVTGNFKAASSIATLEVVTKIVLYYLHERVWGSVAWGKNLPPASADIRA